ncbi:hypothetical protein N4T77_14270 [Clostridium sp. CX1]|uniref:Transporter n=1 Tax=Clostridium tanneri TaxID=3037988 RepID=A0ABU4JSE6_9CLOT|nr:MULTISPECIES: hypothetical protein [unclassified Clostridium]MCT8977762.1 hypothetical protein [Clostridium sp. CX1]MDW8800879.1 hypothetical protein [Clostridium sp. A1-XYC3]
MYFYYSNCPYEPLCRQTFQPEQFSLSPGLTGTPPSIAPPGPPPNFIPSKIQAVYETTGSGTGFFYAVDTSVIGTCMFRYVYIWLNINTGFWSWINYVDDTSFAGYRWTGSNWVPFRLNSDLVAGFGCF